MSVKKGDKYESPEGMGFEVTNVTNKVISVEVDRNIRKDGKRMLEVRKREVLVENWASFARPYKKVSE